jgi:hypothetical protein
MIRGSIYAGGQGEHGGTLAFAEGAITDELELAGVQWLSFPCLYFTDAWVPPVSRRGRQADVGRAWSRPA